MYHNHSHKQAIRVIVSEIIMVFTVIATVAVLALIVSGYWLGEGLKVERNGMLQISSVPTGATVTVDGTAWGWLERTNASKVVSAGEHTVSLSKDGYDTWSRTINVTEGLLYRIHYPRLFLNDRTSDSVYDVSKYTSATVSPDGNSMLLMNNTTEWLLLNLEADHLEPKNIDISKLFTSVSVASGADTGLFTGEIQSADWSQDNSHILFKNNHNHTTEWVILNPKDIKNSVNLTREFAVSFTKLEMLDHSASSLLALRSDNLYKVDVGSKQISAILVKDVADFDHFGSEVVFVARTPVDSVSSTVSDSASSSASHAAQSDSKSSAASSDAAPDVAQPDTTSGSARSSTTSDATQPDATSSVSSAYESSENAISSAQPYYLGYLRLGDSDLTTLTTLDTPAQVTISKFYDDKYITLLSGQELNLYRKDDLTASSAHEPPNPVLTASLEFTPTSMTVGHDGEFLELISGTNFATLDMEALQVRTWTIDSSHYGWLDHDMLYSVHDGALTVYDFDGLNRRTLADGASSHFPVTITNDKWLYYVSDGELIREIVNR